MYDRRLRFESLKTRWMVLLLAITVCGPVPALAQARDEAAVSAPRESAQMTQTRLAIESLTEEILAIDAEIERRVGKLVSMLAAVTDSKESGRKIANEKEEVMEGLKKSVDWYRRERTKRQAALGTHYQPVATEDLEKGIAVLDEKVEKRIEQILELSASLSGHKDVEKYERHYDSWDGGWDRRVSDEYRHTQRVSGKTARAHDKVREGLEKSIQQLEQERTGLERRIATTRDPEARKALEKQLATTKETISRRRDQTFETIAGSTKEGRTVSSREATSMDRLIRDMVKEIQHDFRRLEGLVNQLQVEQARMKQLSYR